MPRFSVGQFVQVDPQGIRDAGYGMAMIESYQNVFGQKHRVEVLSLGETGTYIDLLSYYRLSQGLSRKEATYTCITAAFFKPFGPPTNTREMSYFLLSQLERT